MNNIKNEDQKLPLIVRQTNGVSGYYTKMVWVDNNYIFCFVDETGKILSKEEAQFLVSTVSKFYSLPNVNQIVEEKNDNKEGENW